MKKTFDNFNAVRAIAAMAVLIAHVELQKPIHGFERLSFMNLIPLGTIAVTLFFVLSGFLITFLILQEKQQQKNFDLKKFYIRRALRIWPLYFLIIGAALLIYGHLISGSTLLLIIFFLPTVALIEHKLPTMLEPIWSIGIEEQFYLFFPLLFKQRSLRTTFHTLIALFIVLQILKYSAVYLKSQNAYWHFTADYLYYARFDCMILGALAAFLYFNNFHGKFMNTISLDMIYSKVCQYITYALVTGYILGIVLVNLPVVHIVLAILFTIILLNLGTNDQSIISFKSRWLKKIGVVSYGLYLTHSFTVHYILDLLPQNNTIGGNIFLYLLITVTSILLSLICYTYYESNFLRFKKKFER